MKNNQELIVREGVELIVELNRIILQISSSTETGKVRVKCEAPKINDLSELLDIDYQESDNKLIIKERDVDDVNKLSKAFLHLSVPQKINATVSSLNSSLSLHGLKGIIQAESKNGKIKVSNTGGKLSIITKNGSISAQKTEGTVTLQTKNGSIEINEGSGILKSETGNGSITCNKASFDKAEVSTKNGYIYYEMPVIEKGSFKLKNKNGAIRVYIPLELPYNLTAKTHNGRFNFGLPDDYEAVREGFHKVIRSVRGAGKVNISAENYNGFISIFADKSKIKQGKVNFDFNDFSFNFGQAATGSKNWKDNFKRGILDMLQDNFNKAGGGKYKSSEPNFENNKKSDQHRQSQDENNETEKSDNDLKVKILQMLEQETITTEEADKLINAITGGK